MHTNSKEHVAGCLCNNDYCLTITPQHLGAAQKCTQAHMQAWQAAPSPLKCILCFDRLHLGSVYPPGRSSPGWRAGGCMCPPAAAAARPPSSARCHCTAGRSTCVAGQYSSPRDHTMLCVMVNAQSPGAGTAPQEPAQQCSRRRGQELPPSSPSLVPLLLTQNRAPRTSGGAARAQCLPVCA